jgi:antitoxin component of MazEF toxin-antitoxin module
MIPMNVKTKVVRIGNSLGIRLARDVVARMRISEGSALSVTEISNGIQLQKIEPNEADIIAFADKVFSNNDELFRLLSK